MTNFETEAVEQPAGRPRRLHRATLVALPVLAALAIAGMALPGGSAPGDAEAASANQAPDIATRLRYIGRDVVTGMPAPVDDRFIAEQEHAVETYGEVETDPIPPPPVSGTDVVSIRIGDIGVDAPVGRYGVDRFGRLDVPQDRVTVGWNPGYTTLPGAGASTFFAAHYEYAGSPGVFFELSTLQPGARVEVSLSDGSTLEYAVISAVDYPLGAIDMGALLDGLEGRESVVLMTCSGPPSQGEYPLRTVVLAERVS